MKKFGIIILCLIFILNKNFGQNFNFQKGEKLTYKIFYNVNFIWMTAGEVTFEVDEDDTQFHFKAEGKTYKSYEWFYKVHDKYDSKVSKKTLFPTYSIRNIREGGYSVYEKVAYDQAARTTKIWRCRKPGDPEAYRTHTVSESVHDLLSVMYFLRNSDFSDKKPGHSMKIRLYLDEEEYPLKVHFLGKNPKKKVHNMGNYRCLEFEPEVIAGNVFKSGDKMKIWVSDDENKIPLLIESPISVGSVKMVIKEYSGLKYPFLAKID